MNFDVLVPHVGFVDDGQVGEFGDALGNGAAGVDGAWDVELATVEEQRLVTMVAGGREEVQVDLAANDDGLPGNLLDLERHGVVIGLGDFGEKSRETLVDAEIFSHDPIAGHVEMEQRIGAAKIPGMDAEHIAGGFEDIGRSAEGCAF